MSTTLDAALAAAARDHGSRPALVWDGPGATAGAAPAGLDHAGLDAAVEGAARWLLSLGVVAGERVAWCLPKGPAAVLVHLACLRLGAVSVPLNPRAPAAERAHPLRDAEPALLVHDGAATPDGPALPDVVADPWRLPAPPATDPRRQPGPAPGDLACLLYTSGTTGAPKGAMLTHAGLAANDRALRQAWRFGPDDRLLHVLPLFHVHGLFVALHLTLGSGACVRLVEGADGPRLWRLLREDGVSVFMAVPTLHHRLLASAPAATVALPDLRLVTSGSAPLRPATLDAFERLTGQRILERYGMTEVGMACSNPYDGERRAGTVGFDLPGMHTRLVGDDGAPVREGDVGEVQIRGDAVFAGYWRRPEQTRAAFSADGWLRSGDLGRRDEAGALVLVGRSKELIISGGFNVVPGAVEELLLEQPGVAEAAVFGLPDDDLGERVVAAVVPAQGARLDTAALLERCRQQLSGYKRPRQLFVVEALPRNALGKLQRGRLPAWVGAGRADAD